jgi:hypothetical protein
VSTTAIGKLEPRRRATVSGEILSVVSYELPWVRTDVELGDDSGVVLLRFMGRADVPGLVPGRRIIVEGTPSDNDGRLMMHNPLYEFGAVD